MNGSVHRKFVNDAVSLLRRDALESSPTPMRTIIFPEFPELTVLVKDESAHPTGSLKHRLARSLLLYGLVNGRVGPSTRVIEASSGSTAISEAYFCQQLGLKLVAVMAASTSPEKIALIESLGGRCELVENPADVYAVSERLGAEPDSYYLDQFTHAECATDWRGNHNLAEELFSQSLEAVGRHPDWVVVGSGTGGTSATIGRHIRYCSAPTKLAVVDPEGSSFYGHWARTQGRSLGEEEEHLAPSRIEGIGRMRVEPSFIPTVIDEMFRIPDEKSLYWMRQLKERWDIDAGASTGTNIAGLSRLAASLRQEGRSATVATLICDSGQRYASTYANPQWCSEHGLPAA